ncbi:MAG: hypothetical protein ACOCRN_04620 [Spirochaetia bacterium]
MNARSRVVTLLLLFSIAGPAGALSLDLRAGPLWIGNAYLQPFTETRIEGSEVSPLLTLPGVSVGIPIDSTFTFSPGLDIWYKDYAFTEGRGVPTGIETAPSEQAGREVAGTVGFMLSPAVDAHFPTGEATSVFAGFSPTLLLRAPLAPIEESPTQSLTGYFYSDLRFFYPELRFGGTYEYTETLGIRALFRTFLPVTGLADSEVALPWWDQLMVSGQIGITIEL